MQHVVTIETNGYMDVVGPFKSEDRAERYARMRGLDSMPKGTHISVRPLLCLSPETQRDLA